MEDKKIKLVGTVDGIPIFMDPYASNNIFRGRERGSGLQFYVAGTDVAMSFKNSLRTKSRKDKIKLIFNI